MRAKIKLAFLAVAVTAYLALGWIAGLAVLVGGAVVLLRDFTRTRRALAPEIVCPWCRESVPQFGAYSCGNCRQRTMGWAWQCSACSSFAGHIECPHCAMSITNPMLPPP